MKNWFKKFVHTWKVLLGDKVYVVSLIIGLLMSIFGFFITDMANIYNDARKYVSVGDVIIDNIPVVNMEIIFTWGIYFLAVLMVVYPLLFKPEIGPFALKAFAILMYARAGFILLTNIGPPADSFYVGIDKIGGHVLTSFLFRNDMFFSGHVAYPFMAFLVYGEARILRWIFFAGAIVEGIAVLFMHIHYSIDVFAAFFIAYGIYKVTSNLFEKMNMRYVNRLKLYGYAVINQLEK